MVRSKEEILASIRTKIGDDTSDEAIALVEDINDSFDDLSTRLTEAGDWKAKYEENDKAWRDKYTERFFTPSDDNPIDSVVSETVKEVPDDSKTYKYEDLFSVG